MIEAHLPYMVYQLLFAHSWVPVIPLLAAMVHEECPEVFSKRASTEELPTCFSHWYTVVLSLLPHPL